jgi:hypothetical protein
MGRVGLVVFLSVVAGWNVSHAAVDWSQPPVGCIEEIVPSRPDRPCPDLTSVADPRRDWPAGMDPADLAYFKTNKHPLQYCRSTEMLRREARAPGTYSPVSIEVAWMWSIAGANHAAKVKAIYSASRAVGMPAHVLTGALYQESLMAELGIAQDGNNYSCGIGQINILEWCRWANVQSAQLKQQMGWPQSGLRCEDLELSFVKPFYDIAKSRLNGLPEYRLLLDHFKNIGYNDVVGKFPSATEAVQKIRYQAVRSFIDNCSEPNKAITAKAHELADLFKRYVPAGMKQNERYAAGDGFKRKCQDTGNGEYYPLHAGWLIAVGSYNAGPQAVDALAHYQKWDRAAVNDPATFRDFTPANMIESLYWAGKWNPQDDKIHFTLLWGREFSWPWFRACVLQRHIARVAEHVTAPGQKPPVSSMEDKYGTCMRSQVDSSGKVIKTGVPSHRQTSSGIK